MKDSQNAVKRHVVQVGNLRRIGNPPLDKVKPPNLSSRTQPRGAERFHAASSLQCSSRKLSLTPGFRRAKPRVRRHRTAGRKKSRRGLDDRRRRKYKDDLAIKQIAEERVHLSRGLPALRRNERTYYVRLRRVRLRRLYSAGRMTGLQ